MRTVGFHLLQVLSTERFHAERAAVEDERRPRHAGLPDAGTPANDVADAFTAEVFRFLLVRSAGSTDLSIYTTRSAA